MANKKLMCKQCKEYVPREVGIKTPRGFFCSLTHAQEFGQAKAAAAREKAFRAETRRRKRELKPMHAFTGPAQLEFNRFIRLRDYFEPCISCGKDDVLEWHAGHFLSVGSHPELRFNEDNVHKQCSQCNTHKSGNQLKYRQQLVAKIGLPKVEQLETQTGQLKLTREQITELRKLYKSKADRLQRELDERFACC